MDEFNTALIVFGGIIGLFALAMPFVCKGERPTNLPAESTYDLPQEMFDNVANH